MTIDDRTLQQIAEDTALLDRILNGKVYADDVPSEVMNRLRRLDHVAIDSSKMPGPDILFVTKEGMRFLCGPDSD